MSQTTNFIALVKPTYLNIDTDSHQNGNDFEKNHVIYKKIDIKNEFNHLLQNLSKNYVNYIVYDSPKGTPDGVFPNNWITFHWETKTPTIVIYPMKDIVRRKERQSKLLTDMKSLKIFNIIDLTYFEKKNQYLEGTGSLVLDRINKIAYSCHSCRTNQNVLDYWAYKMDYKICSFRAYDDLKKPVYHTNVMMSIADHFVIVCLDAITNVDRQKVLDSLIYKSNKKIIHITPKQMDSFCGNCLQIKNSKGKTVLCLSETAHQAFNSNQLKIILKYCDGGLIITDYKLIEEIRGGSIRCSLLEMFPCIL